MNLSHTDPASETLLPNGKTSQLTTIKRTTYLPHDPTAAELILPLANVQTGAAALPWPRVPSKTYINRSNISRAR